MPFRHARSRSARLRSRQKASWRHSSSGAVAAAEQLEERILLAATSGVYDENVENTNTVDFVATGSSFTNTQFATSVAGAYARNAGGVINEIISAYYEFGESLTKTLKFVATDGTSWGGGPAFGISGGGSYASTSDGGYNYTAFAFEEITQNGVLQPDEHVVQFGVTVTSTEYQGRARDYGNVTVTGLLSGGGTVSAVRRINEAAGAGDTFYGFAAPTGQYFTGFNLRYSGSTSTPPVQLRFDDIGFITANVVSGGNQTPVASDDSYVADQNSTLSAGIGTPVVDQKNEVLNYQYNVGSSSSERQQQVTAAVAGKLASVDVYIGEFSAVGGSFDFFINRGAPWQTDADSFSTRITIDQSMINRWITIDVSSADLFFTQDEVFTIGTSGTGQGSVFLMGSDNNANSYARGSLWSNGSVLFEGTHDFAFRTTVLSVPTPIAGVLANDSDADGDPLIAVLVAGPQHGTLDFNSDGSFTYTPTVGYVGPDSFTYRANDGIADSNLATIAIDVQSLNDPPTANNRSATTLEDTAVTITPTGSDPEGDPLQFALVTGPQNGTVTKNAAGDFVYTPNSNFFGSDSFTYAAFDGTSSSAPATVSITVTPVNDAPVAQDDSYLVAQGGTLVAGTPSHVIDQANTSHNYQFGTLSGGERQQQVTAGKSGRLQTVEIMINDLNTQLGSSFTVFVNRGAAWQTDLDDFRQTFTVTSGMLDQWLSVDVSSAGIVLQQGEMFTIGVIVNSGSVYLLGTNGNTYASGAIWSGGQLVGDGSYDLTFRTTVAAGPASTPGLLDNDSDVDHPVLTSSVVTGPSHGTLLLNADGSFTYTPSTGFTGIDSFTYRATDGAGESDTATVSLVVGQPASLTVDTLVDENDGNYSAGDLSLREAISLVADGGTITFSAALAGGTITLTNGEIRLARNVSIQGLGASQLAISGNSSSRIFSVTSRTSVEIEGLTLKQGRHTAASYPGSGGAIENWGNLTVTATLFSENSTGGFGGAIENYGTLTVTASQFTNNSSGNYAGAIHNRGTATISGSTFTGNSSGWGGAIYNDTYNSTGGVLSITNTTIAGNSASWGGGLYASNNTITTLVGVTVSGNAASEAAGGISSVGDLRLFNVTISGNTTGGDGGGLETGNLATLRNVTIFGNQAGRKGGTSYSGGGYRIEGGVVTMQNTLIAGNLLGNSTTTVNDVRGWGTPATGTNNVIADAASTAVPTNGVDGNIVGADWTTVINPTLANNGGPTKTHALLRGGAAINGGNSAQALGPDGSPLTVDQRGFARFVGTVDIGAVEASNSPPVVPDLVGTISEDTLYRIQSPATDADGDPLTYALLTGPQNGRAFVSPSGLVSYFPNQNFYGSDTFTYTVSDGFETITATVALTINPINDPAYAGNMPFTTLEDTPLNEQLLFLEVEGDPVQFTLETGPSHGSLVLDSDGSFTYTPDPDFSGRYIYNQTWDYYGSDTFTYRVSDDKGASTTGIVVIDITPVDDAPVASGDTLTVSEDQTLTLNVAPVSRLVMHSEPGDYIGAGLDYDYSSTDLNFDGRKNSDNGVRIWATSQTDFWDLNFAAPFSALLTPGEYLNAMRFPFQNPDRPGLDVSGNGRGSNTLTGEFHIYDVVWNSDQTDVLSFAASFEQHYSGNEPALLGTVQYNTTIGAHGGVLTNDSDADGDFLTTIFVSGPSHGTLTLGRDGSLVYTPNANFSGTDTFSYRITDGALQSEIATVTINVDPVNDGPVLSAESYSFSVQENSPVGTNIGTVAATDVDGHPIGFSITSGNDSGAFAIDAATGVITVADSSKLDFETTPRFSLTIRATEITPVGLFDEATIIIDLSDIVAPSVTGVRFGYGQNRWISATELGSRNAPWQITKIEITFDSDVDIDMEDLVVTGSISGPYSFSGFSYTASTRTAVWTLSTPISFDHAALSLDGTTTGGVSVNGERLLGGNYSSSFDVLFGDVNDDGVVNVLDALIQRTKAGTADLWSDLDGDGVVNVLDALLLRLRAGTSLN